MCFDKKKFEDVSESSIQFINLANNDSTKIEGIGIAKINPNKKYKAKLEETLFAGTPFKFTFSFKNSRSWTRGYI